MRPASIETPRLAHRSTGIVVTLACLLFATDTRAQAPAPGLTPDELRAAVERRFEHDPPVLAVVGLALELAGLDPSRIRARSRRGRRSGLLPSVRFGATRQRGIDQSQTTAPVDDVSRADSLRLEASFTFDLARLVYGPDEPAWSREERAMLDAASSLAREVIEAYFRRQRLIIEIELLGESDADKLLALAEADALLQVFTDGNFFRIMAEPRGSP